MVEVKTKPDSRQRAPAATRSNACRSLWARRASARVAGRWRVRRLFSVFGSFAVSVPSIRCSARPDPERPPDEVDVALLEAEVLPLLERPPFRRRRCARTDPSG